MTWYENDAAGPPDPAPPPTSRRSRLLALTAIVVVGLLGVWLSARLGRLDTALLFVGVPCGLAFLVSLLPRRSDWGTLFKVVTILLLLASALLHEGALCVLIASPLIYGAAAMMLGLFKLSAGQRHAVLPVVALVALEGALPGARVNAEQSASSDRIVAAQCADFAAALDRGPAINPAKDRGRLLQVAKYPTPLDVTGTGLAVGDEWSLRMADGVITTRVAASAADQVDFIVDSDTARTTRWVGLESGSITWAQTDAGCRATLTIDYTRKLDPSWWFGPVTDVFMDAGASAFLNGLD